jgi:hypothetical protein
MSATTSKRSGKRSTGKRSAKRAKAAPSREPKGPRPVKSVTTPSGKIVDYFTFYLYDPRVPAGAKPKRRATVVATNYRRAALKAASRNITPQVYIRKSGSGMVKIYNTGREEPVGGPVRVQFVSKDAEGQPKTTDVRFRYVPTAKYDSYFLTPLFYKDPKKRQEIGMELNHVQAKRPGSKRNGRIGKLAQNFAAAKRAGSATSWASFMAQRRAAEEARRAATAPAGGKRVGKRALPAPAPAPAAALPAPRVAAAGGKRSRIDPVTGRPRGAKG